MRTPDWKGPLGEAFEQSLGYLESLPERRISPPADPSELRRTLGGPLPEQPADPRQVVADLAVNAGRGTVASGSGRYFGFVIGGAMPAALAADWLTAAWDQNAALQIAGPAASVAEEVAGRWLVELLGLPPQASAGFVTGAQMANFTGLSIGLTEVLRAAGWDLRTAGLWGAPRVTVLVGAGRHDTIDRALRFLGMGSDAVLPVPMDDQGRMIPAALAALLDRVAGPVIVCAQAGNVNTGAIDPMGEICDITHLRGGWVHVDGAFGLWAAASPQLRHLVDGVSQADSWATDAHKWLNVPYDSGLVFCAHPEAHRAAMGIRAGYLIQGGSGQRDGLDYVPDFSRRGRGFAVHSAIRTLGRQGIAELVERCCQLARRFADQLEKADQVEVLNDVALNQVLVRFGADDELTRAVVQRVQNDGTCWMSGTTWRGQAAMRISVSNWACDEEDVDRSVAAILRCARA